MMRNKNTLQKSEQTVLLINFSLRYLHLEEFCIITIQRRNPLNFYLNYGIKMITLVSFTSLSKMSGTWLNSFLMGGTFGVLCVSLSGHLCYQPLTVSAISHFVFASSSETNIKTISFPMQIAFLGLSSCLIALHPSILRFRLRQNVIYFCLL